MTWFTKDVAFIAKMREKPVLPVTKQADWKQAMLT